MKCQQSSNFCKVLTASISFDLTKLLIFRVVSARMNMYFVFERQHDRSRFLSSLNVLLAGQWAAFVFHSSNARTAPTPFFIAIASSSVDVPVHSRPKVHQTSTVVAIGDSSPARVFVAVSRADRPLC